jgi:hypothetical protein
VSQNTNFEGSLHVSAVYLLHVSVTSKMPVPQQLLFDTSNPRLWMKIRNAQILIEQQVRGSSILVIAGS